jgi:hypothetical protein
VKEKIASVQSSTATALEDLQTITTVIQEVGHTVAETAAAMTEHADVSKRVVDQLEQTAKRVSHASRDVASSANASASIATDIGEVNVAAGEIRRGGESERAPQPGPGPDRPGGTVQAVGGVDPRRFPRQTALRQCGKVVFQRAGKW